MKKLISIAFAFVLALTMAACTKGEISVVSANNMVHVEGAGTTSGSGDGTFEVTDGECVAINSEITKGSTQIKITDSTGTVVFDDVLDGTYLLSVDASAGTCTVDVKTDNLDGTVDITSFQKEVANETDSDATVDQGVMIDWVQVGSAEEAAQGAGFDTFDVPAEITIRDTTYTDPAFSYADGVAQAIYEHGAMALFVRKGAGAYTAPLTDRSTDEFAATWTEDHKGLIITCYGAEEGAVTLMEWSIDDQAYAATYQGLGGEEVAMSVDEATALVSSIQ